MFKTVLFSASLLLLLVFAAAQSTHTASAATLGTAAGPVAGAKADEQGQCSVATLKGRYLFAHSGTALPPAFGIKEPTPAGDAGFHIFNGDGTGTDTVTVRIGTTVALENKTIPFKYTVSADCTGHVDVKDGPSFDLFISPKGDEFAVISTAPPGNYVSGIDYRVSNK